MYGERQFGAMGAVGGGMVNAARNSSLGSEACQIKEPAVRREVPEQMDRLESAVNYAENSLQELAQRLEAVTRQTGPTEANAAGVAPGPGTLHGGHIFGLACRVGMLGERMQDLMRRLEV